MFLIALLRELEDLIMASPDPQAAIERAKLAVMTEAVNAGTDAALGIEPEAPGTVQREG